MLVLPEGLTRQDQGWQRAIQRCIHRVGQNHTFIGMYGVYTVFLAGNSPYIRSYPVQIYGSGQPMHNAYMKCILRTTNVFIAKRCFPLDGSAPHNSTKNLACFCF
jgi:hypothetical protein